jgi:hypothetical protein
MSVENKSSQDILQKVADWTTGTLHIIKDGDRMLTNTPIPTGTATLSWGASALVNTGKSVDITASATPSEVNAVTLVNMSGVTGLDYRICNVRTLGGVSIPIEISQVVGNVPKSTLTVIEDCEDAWNEQVIAEVTSAADAADKVVGANSQKFSIGEAFTTGLIGSEAFAAALNLTKTQGLLLRIKSTKAQAAGDIQILLDDTAQCASPLETLSVPALVANTWTRVFLPFANPAALGAIISIGAKLNVDAGAQDIWIDDVCSVVLSTREILVAGMFTGGVNARIELSNDTALGALDSFNAYTQVVGR